MTGPLLVVLAAGAGRRFEGGLHKLRTPIAGRALVAHAVDAAVASGAGPVAVVTGAADVTDLLPDGVTELPNPRWAEGQASSLQTAVAAARAGGHAAVVVGLGDQPGIPASAWAAVAGAGSPIAVATYGGRRRNPVRLAAEVWPLLPTHGDEGARGVLRARPELVEEVPCEGDPGDVDTLEDLPRWS